MAHTANSPEEEDAGLPALPPETEAPEARTVLSPGGKDLVRAINAASKAVGFLDALGDRDVAVNVITVMECLGSTAVEALQAGADALRFSDGLVLHGVQWARVPGVEDRVVPSAEQTWDYRVLLLVSALDPELGEADSPAHQADRETCGVTLYLDSDSAAPATALTALPRQGLTPVAALQAAADTVRQCPELDVHGLLWARVPARWPGGWEYRLTVLAASARPADETAGQPVYLDQASGGLLAGTANLPANERN